MRVRFLELFRSVWKRENLDEAPLAAVERLFGYAFRERSLLATALTHRSSTKGQTEQRNGGAAARETSYERLEFLGDAVLGLLISEYLYHQYPDQDEGELTKLKAALVNEVSLSRVARAIGLGNHLFLSSEGDKSGTRQRSSVLADAYEAVVGAIYVDGGLAPVRRVIARQMLSLLDDLLYDISHFNFKGELLEFLQARALGMPRYQVVSERGPDHAKEFTIAVSVQGETLGTGTGSTKKEAEQKAAAAALEKLSGQKATSLEAL